MNFSFKYIFSKLLIYWQNINLKTRIFCMRIRSKANKMYGKRYKCSKISQIVAA